MPDRAVAAEPARAGIGITAEQRRCFDTDGYFVVEGELSGDEVAEFLDVIDRLDATVRRDRRLAADAPVSIRHVVSRDPVFLALLDRPRILAMIVGLLGPRIQLRSSNFDVRPPQPDEVDIDAALARDRFKIWHRDAPHGGWPTVGGVVPFMELKVGYFLTDLTAPLSGALRVLAGSHGWSQADGLGGSREPDPDRLAELNVPAGTALVWRTSLLHRVAPNCSGRTRKCIYLAYQHRWLRPSDYVAPSADLLARCNPVQRQLLGALGEGMCDLRDPDVEPCSPYWTPRPEDVPLEAWARSRGVDDAPAWDVAPG